MKKLRILLLIALVSLSVVTTVQAQEQAYIISSTSPISDDLRNKLNAWLATSPPANQIYFAVTYWQPTGLDDYYVCLVALDLLSPTEPWSFFGIDNADGSTTESKVTWWGTVRVYADGTVELRTPPAEVSKSNVLAKFDASVLPGPGGGPNIRFPWQPSKAVRYGRAGVHPVGHGFTNPWRMVDFHSGTDMGSGAANDTVYASADGDVIWLCEDDTLIVQIDNGEDSFLYGDLLPNANLVMDHAFDQSEVVGSVKHGTYLDTCGAALQSSSRWRMRWGFEKGDNADPLESDTFQAEGCILTGIVENYTVSSAGVWECGTEKIKPGDLLTHYGIIPGDDYGSVNQPKFFTLLLVGMKAVFDALVGNILPEHNSPSAFVLPIMNGVKIVFRITNVLIRGNFNLVPAMTVISLTIGVNLGMSALYLAGAIIRIIKGLPGF